MTPQSWHQFNQDTVDALLADGTDAEAEHIIEHHLACANFDQLEKAAVDAFKAGFEVDDAEELSLDDGGLVYCFDAIKHQVLNVHTLNQDTDTLSAIAEKHKVQYDGWGTYFVE